MSRDPHKLLTIALAEHLGSLNDFTSRTRDWSSATFTGMRHEMRFTLPWSARAVIAIVDLPEADLPMKGHFVADLRVIQCERRGAALHVELEALTIEEA